MIYSAWEKATATIASGATTSGAVNFDSGRDPVGLRLFAIVTPSALTGTTFTFQASVDGGMTWVPMYDIYGSALSVTVGTSRYIPLDPADFAAVTMLKIVSGSTEAADRTIGLVLRSV